MREFWGTHHSIDISPDNIQLYNVTGFPSPFAVSAISIPRGGQDSNTIRLGGEYKFAVGEYQLQPRAGFAYETSGIQEAYVSPLTIDSNKMTHGARREPLHRASTGGSTPCIAHVFANDVTVTPQEAAVPRVNPVKGNPTQTASVNGGQYSSRADVLGVGMEYRF